jgi:hypothetical protein
MWPFNKDDAETTENINYGQIVVITARWILIAAGWVLTLWQPEATAAWQLRVAIILLMAYSSVNFFLTVQWANRSKVLADTVYLTSAADLSLITVLVAVFGTSNVYVFYLPALLALAVTLPRSVTGLLTCAVMSAYGVITFARAGETLDTAELQSIFVRLILLATIAFCGSLYREIEADRRAGKGRIFTVLKELSAESAQGSANETRAEREAAEARA